MEKLWAINILPVVDNLLNSPNLENLFNVNQNDELLTNLSSFPKEMHQFLQMLFKKKKLYIIVNLLFFDYFYGVVELMQVQARCTTSSSSIVRFLLKKT